MSAFVLLLFPSIILNPKYITLEWFSFIILFLISTLLCSTPPILKLLFEVLTSQLTLILSPVIDISIPFTNNFKLFETFLNVKSPFQFSGQFIKSPFTVPKGEKFISVSGRAETFTNPVRVTLFNFPLSQLNMKTNIQFQFDDSEVFTRIIAFQIEPDYSNDKTEKQD
ncbi:Hypothetical_protein [Hexamita inflata]|uniref:Hypothetical_protein n=1 Tax=Hexamita inflata TaxID=28002 RepID=A0AA86Q004_9EUKA|nr:Hypothetical protein HINF_LOCUS34932 [Hexamita inflata]